MYIYEGKKIQNPIYIHFLCGCKYTKENISDKRNVLLKYINNEISQNKALILEKLFSPKLYLKMGFNNLEDVELMTSYYAKSIIVLHETISTAAEIALFGSKNDLNNKLLVLYASKKCIKYDSLGAFLKLAYFNKDRNISKLEQNYHAVLNSYDASKINYYITSFYNNAIDIDLKQYLNDFWEKIPDDNIFLQKNNIFLSNHDNHYSYNSELNRLEVSLNYTFIFSFVICCLINSKIIKTIRENNKYVPQLCEFLKELIKNTVQKKEGYRIDDITVKTFDKKDINIPIKYCLYLLNGLEYIKFNPGKEITISSALKEDAKEYKDLIKEEQEKNFFGDNENG